MQILVGTLFLSLATRALAAAVLEERAQCNADNCLRNLKDQRYSSSASVFCSEWLRSTLTNTISVLSTVSVTATITPPHATLTSISSSIQTITATITQTTTITAPNGGGGMTLVKREIIGYPAWLSATYPATRVSSACSCFISDANPPFPATTTVTATNTLRVTITLPTVTDTILSVVPTQSTSTATSIVTATVCETPRILASGLCYDLRSDENNCGAVGAPAVQHARTESVQRVRVQQTPAPLDATPPVPMMAVSVGSAPMEMDSAEAALALVACNVLVDHLLSAL
ncbi:hypothetical protein H072_2431 [Dactylellina haptotyla CBS 200.50]|uniref:Uncharacterized protein n=1 Tax=Dactylellina haptotyla (strain CBS 200.50) TaxID=1284197 RepID=S8C748_DACHA|nr:hypothetical protein H072_2431 [Dactylellina haptotyla CBS 200.50]